ncbi:hypothetical protein [Clostridium tepidum]|jgi:hypothetical protein|uniref:Uncharacterized protein n=1 Tax=Clostridium tepidum TaxID=1962263 RepID=A0ABX3L6T0_9CLOT|nr:hypothetical protein [Clostridium tepidum]MDU6877799.1 hypothetical protein [Clostridium botulinum]OOO63337.1 hypothetical protein BS637_02835 [Clostridium tepidum]
MYRILLADDEYLEREALKNEDITYLSKYIKDLELLNCIQIQINNIKNDKNKFSKFNKVLYPALEYIESN